VAGADGRDGRDYQGPSYRDMRSEFTDFIAASSAIQMHLPQHKTSRVTANLIHVGGSTGVGFGYARKYGEDSDVTFGVGTSGGKHVVQFGISGEF